MSVFVLRADAQALVDAKDPSTQKAAFETMIKNASVDNAGDRISLFLDDLRGGPAPSSRPTTPTAPTAPTTSAKPATTTSIQALKLLFANYAKNPTPIDPGIIDSPTNPSCLGSGQQDTEEYFSKCISGQISPISTPPLALYSLQRDDFLQCIRGRSLTGTDPKIYSTVSNPISHLNIPLKSPGNPAEPNINMIDKLIEYTAVENNFQFGDKVDKKDKKCSDDLFDTDGTLTSKNRQRKTALRIPDDNIYMILCLIILNGISPPHTKYTGKITIPTSFFINPQGEFARDAGRIEYRLLGFTAHYGGWSGGHYVYYKKIKDGTDKSWVCISDRDISPPMDEATALLMNDHPQSQCKDFLYIKENKYADYFKTTIVTNGFVNSTGSLCYANSMNQLLLSMPEFVDYISKWTP